MSNTRIKGIVLCMLVLAPILKIYCQADGIGARSTSLAGLSSVLEDVWATANNPAGLGSYKHLSVATNYEKRYLLTELNYYNIALSLPTGSGSFGLFSGLISFQNFIDQKVNLAYGNSFGERLLCGVSIAYFYQKAGEVSDATHQLSYQLGTIIDLSDKLHLGFTAFNPFQFYFKNVDYATLPSILKLGMTYKYDPSFFIYVECEKDLDFSPRIKLGGEYYVHDDFIIRGGFRIFPVVFAFGVSFRKGSLLFDISSHYHQYLGFTPQVSLQYDFR